MQNTFYTGDNLYILNGMNSETVDLIYLDPPFNSKRTYSAPVGSRASGASFKDIWTWEDVDRDCLAGLEQYPKLVEYIYSIGAIHSTGMMSYVVYMAQRIIQMHRVLRTTGSFYLHCDTTASHYLKIVLDQIFGEKNFRNEIDWVYNRFSRRGDAYPSMKDTIFFYTKSDDYHFTPQSLPPRDAQRYEKGYHTVVDKGQRKLLVYDAEKAAQKMKRAKAQNIPISMTKARAAIMGNVWTDIPILNPMAKERTGYPTQKPLALLYRIIEASSKAGDVVFDPFCGCATTCVAAQQRERQWIGIDIESQARELLMTRLGTDAGMFKDFLPTDKIPNRTDIKLEKPSKPIKDRLFEKQEGLCNGCAKSFDSVNFEIDHIIPKSKGGGDYYENFQLLCGNCNRARGNRPMEVMVDKIRKREGAKG
ncbi:MAG: DNA methyltransferase [Candidatus Halichondribacter symbioticus]